MSFESLPTDVQIVVTGGGIGGLAVAQGLRKMNIPFILLERDASLHERRQGYRVRIADEGIAALQNLLTEEHYARLLSCCANRETIASGLGNAPAHHIDARSGGPGIPLFAPGTPFPTQSSGHPLSADRTVLRNLLSEGIGDSLVFNAEYARHEENDESVEVFLADGRSIRTQCLVGCDGLWSSVRRSSVFLGNGSDRSLGRIGALLDTDGRLIYGKTALKDLSIREGELLARPGMTLVHDVNLPATGTACLIEAMRFDRTALADLPEDYLYWVLFLPRSMREEADRSLLEEVNHALVKNATAFWDQSLHSLFRKATAMTLSRILTADPSYLPELPNDSRVTLMGDAVHAMSPTAAFGATTALRDASCLIVELMKIGGDSSSTTRKDFAPALRAYEAQMRRYAAEAMNRSALGGKLMFGMKPFAELKILEVPGTNTQ